MSNKPINKKLRGIRDAIPPGYVVGRTGAGSGPPILLPISNFASKGYVANTTIQIGGAAGGDLSGTYPNPTVAKIQGNAVKTGVPTDKQVLQWINANSDWEPKTIGLIPAGGTTGQVLEKNSNTDYDLTWASGSGGAPASCADDGTLHFSIVDGNGQLVLDSNGNPIYMNEVLPLSSLPALATTNLTDVATGTWTPTDTSGGGLTFSSTSAGYTRIGNMVFIYAQITYPTTADTHNSQIGGLPFTAAAPQYANTIGIVENSLTQTYHTLAQIIRNTKTLELQNGLNDTILTNANLSTATINFSIAYPIA